MFEENDKYRNFTLESLETTLETNRHSVQFKNPIWRLMKNLDNSCLCQTQDLLDLYAQQRHQKSILRFPTGPPPLVAFYDKLGPTKAYPTVAQLW